MAGLVPPDASPDATRTTYIFNLRQAARRAAQAGVTLLIEPINPRDMPGFFLSRQDQAHALLQAAAELGRGVLLGLPCGGGVAIDGQGSLVVVLLAVPEWVEGAGGGHVDGGGGAAAATLARGSG